MTEHGSPRTDTANPRASRAGEAAAPLVRATGITKRYGPTVALDAADIEIRRGEVLGLVGHNGAGKSTLMRVLAGITTPDAGGLELAGEEVSGRHGPTEARRAGVRIVFQEFSLCPSLRVFEGVMVSRPSLAGPRWRRRARELIARQLDDVCPGHGISPWARIESLSLAQRQMVEIAQATLGEEGEVRLVILDEPTSALGQHGSESLFRYLARQRDAGVSFVLISHRIGEMLANTDRVTVMRDGRQVTTRPSGELSEGDLVTLMGGAALEAATREARRAPAVGEPAIEVAGLSSRRLRNVELVAHRGEIVGLAGLEGQGQQELLLELWRRRAGARRGVDVGGRMSFVTGDRQAAGVFPLWSVGRNLTVASLSRMRRGGAVSPRLESAVTSEWMQRLAVRGRATTAIGDLSGGNQQKVLIARALAAGADIVLLDDPFRGVDIGTRQDTYRLIREEAAGGRCFVWFSTENAELEQCDRVYILREGAIVAELAGADITEDRLIAASFRRPEEVGA